MAIVSCAADNIRLNESDNIFNGTWISPGSGMGLITETDIVYQGNSAISRKIHSADRGIYYTHNSKVDMSSGCVCLFKVNITNHSVAPTIRSGGISVWCGENHVNNYGTVCLGSDTYPSKGGWVLIPFSPSSSGASIKGTPPELSEITSFGIQVNADFGAVSKTENVVIDAIDVGRGVYIYGGTDLDDPGTFDDLVLFDQGTQANRWGYVTEHDDIISVYGRIGIGFSAVGVVSTRFEDREKIIVFPDGIFEHDFSGIIINTGICTTKSFSCIENCTFIRPNIWIEGNVGYCTFFNNRFERLNKFHETNSDVKLDVVDCVFDHIKHYEHHAGYIDGCSFNIAPQKHSNVGMMICNTKNVWRISNCTFTSFSSSGHAIEIKSAGSYDLIGNQFINFDGELGTNLISDSGSHHAAILNSSGGCVELNVASECIPSIRNIGEGSITKVNSIHK